MLLTLTITYPVERDALGAPEDVLVGFGLPAPQPSGSDRGEYTVTIDGKTWRAPWLPGLSMPTGVGGRPKARFGASPIAARGARFNPDLLAAISNSRSAVVSLRSQAGAVIAERTFDLSDKSGQDELFAQAIKAPESCRTRLTMPSPASTIPPAINRHDPH
jgi:hypothetical protein